MELFCKIHDIAVYLDDEDKAWKKEIRTLLKEQFDGFEPFSGNDINKKMVIKNLNKLDIDASSCIVVPDNSYYLDDDIIYSLEMKIAFRVTNNQITFWVNEETWFAPYLLQFMLEMHNKTFIHGAGVAVKNDDGIKKGIMIVAFGGIGKTCFISEAMKRDEVSLLGDDLIIVSSDGNLQSYPRPFCVYKYHVPLFKDYFSKHKYKVYHVKNSQYFLRAVRKIKRKLGYRLKNSREYMLVPPAHIFGNEKIETESVQLDKVYVLRRRRGISRIALSNANDMRKLANFAQNIILHEWDMGMRLFYNYKAEGFGSICDYMQHTFDILNEAFNNIDDYVIVDIPEKMGATEVSKELVKILLDNLE